MRTPITAQAADFPFAQDLPVHLGSCVSRDNILNTLDQIFAGGIDVTLLEGPEGRGKTVTAALFATRHQSAAFTVFLRPGSRWAYDPVMVCTELGQQIARAVGDSVSADEAVSPQVYHSLMLSLRRWLKRQRTPVYFVVDGLYEIPATDSPAARQIWDLLPLDVTGCKFLITRDTTSQLNLPRPSSTKDWVLPLFNLEESIQFLNDTGLSRDNSEQLHRTCQGQPGWLATARRIVQSGVPRDILLDEVAEQLSTLFEIEWRTVDPLDSSMQLGLAILAHDPRRHTVSDLARLTKMDEEGLVGRLKKLSFLEVIRDAQLVSFASEPSRRYASNRLSHLRQTVNDVMIQDLLERKDQDSVTTLLPTYLHQAGRYDELLHFLTPEYFERTLQHTESMAPVKQQVDLGVKASMALNRDGELVRFSIHKSALTQLESTDAWKAEIEARIALDDFDMAHGLANAAGLKEDRLHLLSVVAKAKVRRGMTLEPELIESIKSLYNQIDRKSLGKRALEIAADMVYAAPALAVEMVEDSSSADSEDSDLAIAGLALAAPRTHLEDEQDPGKDIRSRIRSPEIKKFTDEASIRIRDTSAREILAQVEQIDSPERKLFFLRRWNVQNRSRRDASVVIEAALNLAIQAASYTPNARDMRELSSPLPFVEDAARRQHLVAMFAANKGNVQLYGPTVDYVRFLLNLARGEYRHDRVRGRDWFEEAYITTCDVKDLAARAECFAWLLVVLGLADAEHHLESSDQLHSLAETGLNETVEELRNAAALHDAVFSGIIRALARNRLDLAVAIACSLNTEPRRDGALVEVVDAAMTAEEPPGGLRKARGVIEKIINPEVRDEALYKVLDRARRRVRVPEAWGDEVLELFEPIQRVADSEVRCRCLCRFYVVLAKTAAACHDRPLKASFEKLMVSLEEIDIGWNKVRTAFEAAALLAPHSSDHARGLIALAETAKQNVLLQTARAADVYIGTILLAIAAYSGLLPRQLSDDEDLQRLAGLIDRIPSDSVRIRVWSELALRAQAFRRRDLCERVVSEHVRPLLHSLRSESPAFAATVIARVAPALYCAHLVTAKEDFRSLAPHVSDSAYYNTCAYILTRHTQHEPFETVAGQGYDIGYEQALELCDLVECIEEDGTAYTILHSLISSLDGRQRDKLTRDQMETLVAKLQAIATRKFPNPKHIAHDGYLLCTQAMIERLRRSSGKVWDTLAAGARLVPNLSDRVFVLCTVATECLSRERGKSRQLLDEAYQMANAIPCVYDRVARTNMVAKQAWEVDHALAKRLLESSLRMTIDDGGSEFWPLQRDALDFAHRVDPDWAAQLVAIADTDPVRIQTRVSLLEHLDVLKTARALADQPKTRSDEDQVQDVYPQAAWRLLGKLNAGRIETRHQEEMRKYVEVAAGMPFSKAYPILAWVIGNAVKRFADTDQARTILRPMFEATLLASQIAARMADQKNRVQRDALMWGYKGNPTDKGGLIRAGERELAMSRIRHWIEEKVQEYLIICDPFFGPEDLEVLKLVLEIKPTTRVRILTSTKHQLHMHVAQPYQETYISHWRTKVSDQEPPDTQIVVVGTHRTKDSPIHDRWWFTVDSGLRFGTSFRSLGIGKDAELSELPSDSVVAFSSEVSRYLHQEAREHEGEKLSYSMFTLD